MTRAQDTDAALQMAAPYGSVPRTLPLQRQGDTGTVGKAEEGQIFSLGEKQTQKHTTVNILGFKRVSSQLLFDSGSR